MFDLDNLLHQNPRFLAQREELVQAGIRYAIFVDAWTTESHHKEWGFPVPFTIKARSWTRHSHITAEVLDIKEAQRVGVIQVEASGRPWAGVFVFIPMGAPAFTESGLCGDLGEGLAKFFAGETTAN
ncbi:MAG: hypothetical protein VST64_01405 [Nitrospirota bacterium]|nr:hypothetical protein [Nitrospirota bacterium]